MAFTQDELSEREKRYLDDISRNAGPDHPLQQILRDTTDKPRQYHLCDREGLSQCKKSDSAQPLLRSLEGLKNDTVCVIENISARWIATLGVEWNLDPTFFLDYMSDERKPSLWDNVMGHEAAAARSSADRKRSHRIIEGLISDVKSIEKDEHVPSGVTRPRDWGDREEEQISTRISYLRVRSNLYLFLVDPPIEPNPLQFKPYLPSPSSFRLPDDLRPSKLMMRVHAANIGGYSIPQLYHQKNLSCFAMLQSFLSHSWHMDLLFGYALSQTIDPTFLSQCLSASLWRTNLTHVHRSLRRIAFRTLKYDPDMSTNQDLHGLREDLETLRGQMAIARDWMPDCSQLLSAQSQAYRLMITPPKRRMEQTLEDAVDVQKFLMDTFQLLMSTVSVQVSESSISEAKRSIVLTQLATIYVPLSFVTGIWGMNIKEINNSPRPLWMFGVTLVVALVVTAGLLWIFRDRQFIFDRVRYLWLLYLPKLVSEPGKMLRGIGNRKSSSRKDAEGIAFEQRRTSSKMV